MYVDEVEDLPLAAAVPSKAPPVTADPSAGSSIPSPAAKTPALFTPSESPPNTQLVHPASTQSEHVLDSQGFIKPAVIVIDGPSEPPPADPSTGSSPANLSANSLSLDPSASSAARPRISRLTPAPIPEALAAAALRKPTSPSLVSGKPRSSVSSSSPMDAASDLKRKAQTQTEALPRREKKKKGKLRNS